MAAREAAHNSVLPSATLSARSGAVAGYSQAAAVHPGRRGQPSDKGNGRFQCVPPWSVPSAVPPDLSRVSFCCLHTSIYTELPHGSWRHLPAGPAELSEDTQRDLPLVFPGGRNAWILEAGIITWTTTPGPPRGSAPRPSTSGTMSSGSPSETSSKEPCSSSAKDSCTR